MFDNHRDAFTTARFRLGFSVNDEDSGQYQAAAEAYINFLCDPEICGQSLEYLGYSVLISTAKEFMDPEVTGSEVAYPSDETLARGQSFPPLSDQATREPDSLLRGTSEATEGVLRSLFSQYSKKTTA